MSYCRFGWGGSQVYVFESSAGLECCGCLLQHEGTPKYPQRDRYAGNLYDSEDQLAMVQHLRLHRKVGHTVPQVAIDALMQEWVEAQGWRVIFREFGVRVPLGAVAWWVGFRLRLVRDAWRCRRCARVGHIEGRAFPHADPEFWKDNKGPTLCKRCGCFGLQTADAGPWYECTATLHPSLQKQKEPR